MSRKWEESDELQINLGSKTMNPIIVKNITKGGSRKISREDYNFILDVWGDNFKEGVKSFCLQENE